MGDSETAQQGSAGEHAGDVTDNGHAGDVADDEVVGAVPPGAFGPAATSSLQDSLLLMSTEHSNHGSTSSTSPSDVMSTVLAKRHPASALSLAAVLRTVGQICTAPRRSADCTAPLPLRTADHPPALPPESPSTLYVSPVGNDRNEGTKSAPLRTIDHAVKTARLHGVCTIVLRGGRDYFSSALGLTAADPDLSILVYPGESPVLSGGKTLDVPLKKWRMV